MRSDRLSVFYDASCPICSLEIDHLAARDRGCRLDLIDISAPGFNAGTHGFAPGDLEAAMHVRRADGRVVRGVAALRLVYAAVGLGWLLGPTAWPALAPAFDAAYRGFARRRHAISAALAPALRLARHAATSRKATP